MRYYDQVRARSIAIALLEQLAWQLEPREREQGWEILKRVRDRLLADVAGIMSCEFDSATEAARLLKMAKVDRLLEERERRTRI